MATKVLLVRPEPSHQPAPANLDPPQQATQTNPEPPLTTMNANNNLVLNPGDFVAVKFVQGRITKQISGTIAKMTLVASF